MKHEIKEKIGKINKGEIPKGYQIFDGHILPNDWEMKKVENVVGFSLRIAGYFHERFRRDRFADALFFARVDNRGWRLVTGSELPNNNKSQHAVFKKDRVHRFP